MTWHPSEGTILATGGFDRTVCVCDARDAKNKGVRTGKIGNFDVESVFWDPFKQVSE